MKHHWRIGCKRSSKDCRLEDGPCSLEHIITILSCQTFITLSFSFLFTMCRSNLKLALILVINANVSCYFEWGCLVRCRWIWVPRVALTQYLHLRTILIRLWSLKCVFSSQGLDPFFLRTIWLDAARTLTAHQKWQFLGISWHDQCILGWGKGGGLSVCERSQSS